ncbi:MULTISPECIES: tripartite tricarboxylate transporter TctB family protein [unclassified Modicisalibacter]|uniref:tripartite tricarboxylate transporter TctB family protein n=1 Tax=unclassified Modicisalibacter TaxID=2679913 RepID=UPI001CCFAB16|nr:MULTISPECIES: tripartite tricarboxylate transporter TctB family protein [unclassified Modicisalibacter]MBZ9559912.1 tripartite tricarboxylate transporter TctB family protein [Modicisalibacter sp. R2A 31.J]MBZ9575820.1 tripartite tricarboxylate transporter TctB family protein [Modicisalibacter sp. MOD 31.J]
MTRKLYAFIVCVVLGGAFFLTLTWQLPSSEEVSTLIGPRTWPLLVLGAMLVFALMLAIETRIESRKTKDTDATMTEEADGEVAEVDEPVAGGIFVRNRHWVLLGLVVLYTVSMGVVGFLWATIAFSLLCSLTLGATRKLTIVMTTLAGAILVQVVFDTLLNIPLP